MSHTKASPTTKRTTSWAISGLWCAQLDLHTPHFPPFAMPTLLPHPSLPTLCTQGQSQGSTGDHTQKVMGSK